MYSILKNSQIKIIEAILHNPGINLRGIIEKTKISPNYVSGFVNSLVKKRVLKEESFSKRRVYLRMFYIDLKKDLTRNLISLVQDTKKERLFEKYPKIRPVLEQISTQVAGIDFLIVYGSYSRLSAEKDSDLDLLMVGRIKDLDRIREILVSLDIEPSLKIETLSDFTRRIKDDIHKQIVKEGIVIKGFQKFIDVISIENSDN